MAEISEEDIKEHFRLKEEREKEKNSSRKDKEEYNLSRKDYNKEYAKGYRTEDKEAYNLYHKEDMKNRRKNKIIFEEVKEKSDIETANRISSYFPINEFNKRLDCILKDNPSGINKKTLQDLIYDILEKKNNFTLSQIFGFYNHPIWIDKINEIMSERNYSKNGDDTYVHTEK
jgi:hypothetical protein